MSTYFYVLLRVQAFGFTYFPGLPNGGYSAEEIDNYLSPRRIHSIFGRIHSGLEAILIVFCTYLSPSAVYTLLSPDTLYEIECIQRAVF